jgi:tetratricopeptide (TPR) repeat protein
MAKKTLIDQAINAALVQDWPAAIELNHQILADNPNHVPSLNRLARAYKESGDPEQSRQTYKQVLSLDPFNPIAQKCLHNLNGAHHSQNSTSRTFNTDFIEEPGRTKSYSLVRVGDAQILNSLQPGQVVMLHPKKHSVCVTTEDGTHIGALTDDAAFHLKKLLSDGFSYLATIRNASAKSVTVFLRQQKDASNPRSLPSFG